MIGPHTFNFSEAADLAIAAGAAMRITSPEALVDMAVELLVDPDRRRKVGQAGVAFCRQHIGATARTVAVVNQLMRTKP